MVGELVGKYIMVFYCFCIYLVLTIVLYIVKDKILKMPINNFIIAKMLKKVNMKKQQDRNS
jgi:hypothetical protein